MNAQHRLQLLQLVSGNIDEVHQQFMVVDYLVAVLHVGSYCAMDDSDILSEVYTRILGVYVSQHAI